MRTLLTILISTAFLLTKAQSHLPVGAMGLGYSPWQPFMPYHPADSGRQNRKWQVRPFASVSAGYLFYNGGISYVSAPVGLALIHPLTSNVSAFAAVSASPVLFSINRLYTEPAINQGYPGSPFSKAYNFGYNARVEGGLMYTNDAGTFSISGSVGIEKGSYPVYQSNRPNRK